MRAGSTAKASPAQLAVSLARANSPLDNASATREPALEHLLIFTISSVHPMAAATAAMVVTRVLDSRHLVL
jgi:hypothetical protein